MKLYENIDGKNKEVVCNVTLSYRFWNKDIQNLADGITKLHKQIFPQEYYKTFLVKNSEIEQAKIVTVLK